MIISTKCHNLNCPVLQSWPDDALQAVATRFLEEIDMTEEIRHGCIEMCKEFHTSTQYLSDRYHLELDRHNYVTPTSYLEMINTFKTLLDMKRKLVCHWFCLLGSKFMAKIMITGDNFSGVSHLFVVIVLQGSDEGQAPI